MATKAKPKRSNKPGTCLWCGKKLTYVTHTTWERSTRPATAKEIERWEEGLGGNNIFVDRDLSTRDGSNDKILARIKKVKERVRIYDKPGAYGDGFFCSMRHAQDFAVGAALNGSRFVPET